MKNQLLIILFSTILTSCGFEETSLSEFVPSVPECKSEIEPVPDSIYVNINEINRLLVSSISPISTKSRSNGFTIDTIHGDNSTPLIYVVNFGENNGFLLISALKTAFPILAYNNVGHYDATSLNPNAKFVLENMAFNVENSLTLPSDSIQINRNLWKSFEASTALSSRSEEMMDEYETWPDDVKELYHQAVSVMRDSIGHWPSHDYMILSDGPTDGGTAYGWPETTPWEEIYQFAEGACYPTFMCRSKMLSALLRKSTVLVNERQLCGLQTKWGQQKDYNQSYAPLSNGKLPPAGCCAVAAGQIMRFYEWPQSFNWDDMPNDCATKTTSDFLLRIAETADAKYSETKTSITSDNINSAIKKFGYKTNGIKELNSIDPLSISAQIPVLITGLAYDSFKDKKSGHAFVACGYSIFVWQEEALLYTITRPSRFDCVNRFVTHTGCAENVYINWGYYGNENGFFNYNYMHADGLHYKYNLLYIIPTPAK